MSEGIVLQLQAEALDEKVDIENLLRKAYLVARKLQLKDFEEWITCEQNGYKKKVPDYRIISGEIKAWNPYNGWIPVVMEGNMADRLNRMPLSHPIAVLSETYKSSSGLITLTIGGALTAFLIEHTHAFPTNYSFQSTKSELRKILSAVRNRILEWSILLEENGIIGEGLRFNDAELKIAKESQIINNYTNNFFSSADDAKIQQGGKGNEQQ